jgi:four helix bundle protein
MEAAKSFKDLIVWRKAHEHVLSVYALTGNFPKDELYGLTAQMRRAAVSVAANIVEGFKKSSAAEKLRFFNIAEGSLEECRYYAVLARDLSYGTDPAIESLQDDVGKLISGYAAGIRRRRLSGTVYLRP